MDHARSLVHGPVDLHPDLRPADPNSAFVEKRIPHSAHFSGSLVINIVFTLISGYYLSLSIVLGAVV